MTHSKQLNFPKIEIIGDSNLFSALHYLISKNKLNFLKFEDLFSKEESSFEKYSKKLSELKRKRSRKSIGKPFHGIGINVDLNGEIGYRPVTENKSKF